MATTTLAPFQPGLASGGSSSTALATSGGAGSNAGGALATFTPGMDINTSSGMGGASGPLASIQQLMQQPSVKSHAPHFDGLGRFAVWHYLHLDQHAQLSPPHDHHE